METQDGRRKTEDACQSPVPAAAATSSNSAVVPGADACLVLMLGALVLLGEAIAPLRSKARSDAFIQAQARAKAATFSRLQTPNNCAEAAYEARLQGSNREATYSNRAGRE